MLPKTQGFSDKRAEENIWILKEKVRGALRKVHNEELHNMNYSLNLEFDSRRGLGIFLLTTVSRPILGPTQPPIQWVPGALSRGIKRTGPEADHSPPSRAEVKNAWSYTSTLPIRLHGVVLS
jgi:hypothetical protein